MRAGEGREKCYIRAGVGKKGDSKGGAEKKTKHPSLKREHTKADPSFFTLSNEEKAFIRQRKYAEIFKYAF